MKKICLATAVLAFALTAAPAYAVRGGEKDAKAATEAKASTQAKAAGQNLQVKENSQSKASVQVKDKAGAATQKANSMAQ